MKSGFCVMAKSCDNYNDLWNYDFKVQFSGVDDYFRIPLASFATSMEIDDQAVCVIFVEMLAE